MMRVTRLSPEDAAIEAVWSASTTSPPNPAAAELRAIAGELQRAAATGDCTTVYEAATDVVPSLLAVADRLEKECRRGYRDLSA